MILGITASSLTFLAYIVCLASYYIYSKNNHSNFLYLGRYTFILASVLIFLQAAFLMWAIQTHQFQWQYVFNYSSKDMNAFYLTASFWGGQEGTFLLWLMLGSIYGLFLISRRIEDEHLVISFLVLVQAFVAVILIKKNPFTYVWDIFPNHLQVGEIPLDGRGLNPLLQNPWMIIHPPILFIGYSSTSILFAFVMTALSTKNYDRWIRQVFPYALFVALSLGTGIILGGYWAYTTLGWGGYWGWDPVENSSLIPWLTSLALVHTLIIQRRQGSLKRTNIFLALLTFLLVLWGSFLTRSGVLTDFSVHSFSESELNSYLITFVGLFAGISLLSFVFHAKNIHSERVSNQVFTRGNFMLFGMISLVISAIFTFFGTSSPLLTGLFAEKASNVTTEYYNLLNAPVAILLGFFIAFSPILSWKGNHRDKLKGILWQMMAAVLFTIIAYWLGLRDIIPLIIFMFFVLAILINARIVYSYIKAKNFGFGGYLAHVGIGFMMIGVITSSVYDTTDKISLPLGSAKTVMGYDMTYMGFRLADDGKDEAIINVQRNGSSVCEARAKFYWSEYNQAYMRNPAVHNLWLKDLYISPIQLIPAERSNSGQEIELIENNTVHFENYMMQFKGYDMDEHQMDQGEIFVQGIITVSGPEDQFELKPAIKVTQQNKTIIPATFPGSGRQASIQSINLDQKSLTLFIDDDQGIDIQRNQQAEMLAIEITEKPLINMLWIGTFIMISGLVVAIANRSYLKTF